MDDNTLHVQRPDIIVTNQSLDNHLPKIGDVYLAADNDMHNIRVYAHNLILITNSQFMHTISINNQCINIKLSHLIR